MTANPGSKAGLVPLAGLVRAGEAIARQATRQVHGKQVVLVD